VPSECKAMAGRQTLKTPGPGRRKGGAAIRLLPCARITSIRFKGTVSVDGGKAINTPSESLTVTTVSGREL